MPIFFQVFRDVSKGGGGGGPLGPNAQSFCGVKCFFLLFT